MFPVAGIGSSAGGVEALQTLFHHMPADTGMAFILVSHLARDYQSLLPEIVGRHSAMPVHSAQDGARIEPNVIYVCPPNRILTVLLPEFVPNHWWEQPLHNQTTLVLKAALLFRRGVVTVNVPYHMASVPA